MYEQIKQGQSNECSDIISDSTEICITKKDCEIKADICASRRRNVVIWGNVRDCCGCPMEHVLVKLMKYDPGCRGERNIICCTYTDCDGFYQFTLKNDCEGNYKIVVSSCEDNYQNNCINQNNRSYTGCGMNTIKYQ